jgi:hypothetical protein
MFGVLFGAWQDGHVSDGVAQPVEWAKAKRACHRSAPPGSAISLAAINPDLVERKSLEIAQRGVAGGQAASSQLWKMR